MLIEFFARQKSDACEIDSDVLDECTEVGRRRAALQGA
jgi:hypothetical protein